VLDSDDFDITDDKPDPPPSDLIHEKTWAGLTRLSDDVSIRTSDHHGAQLKLLHELWGEWLEAVGDPLSSLGQTLCSDADAPCHRRRSSHFRHACP
jgi:hypothetical protein